VRTAFHDAVARFGGVVSPRSSVVFSSRAREFHATSDTPVALRLRPPLLVEMRDEPKSQDRLATHDVNRTELPRPGMPSSFAQRRSL